MSEEVSFWTKIAEKMLGIILVLISVLMLYFTATSTNVLNVFSGVFGFLGILVLIAGVFLIVAKIPE
jgi:uncharacterized membrane protein HdeD (DUF308 family)